jgi:hypothetical protein
MTLTPRDRRALALLAAALAVYTVVALLPEESAVAPAAAMTPAEARARLSSLRRVASGIEERQKLHGEVKARLEAREKGLIAAGTMAQAQAQMLQAVRKVLSMQSPPVNFRASEFGQPRPAGEHYALTTVTFTLECGIEQIVNLLADLGNQPELMAAQDMSFSPATNPQKNVPLRLTVGALVPRALLEAEEAKKKQGGGA